MDFSNHATKNKNFVKKVIAKTIHVSLISLTVMAFVGCNDNHHLNTLIENPTPPNITSYIDKVGSIQSNNQQSNVTDDDRPSFIIANNLEGAKLYVDGILVESIYDRNLGTLTPQKNISPGDHAFSYVTSIRDMNGKLNDSSQSAIFNLKIVSTKIVPSALSVYNDDVGMITNIKSTETITDDTTPSFYIDKSLRDVKLYIDDNEVESNYESLTGILTPKNSVNIGKHSYRYSFQDNVIGQTEKSEAWLLETVAMANQPPAIINYQDDMGSITDKKSIAPTSDDTTPSFNVGNNFPNVSLYVDDQQVDAIYDKNSGTLTPAIPVSIGKHIYAYSVLDSVTGESPKSIAFAIETVLGSNKPVAITSYRDNYGDIKGDFLTSNSTDDNTPSFNINKNLNDVKLYIDGKLAPSIYDASLGVITPTELVMAGSHNYSYTIFDKVTGESPKSDPFYLQYTSIADLENKIANLEKLANDPNIPFTTPEEFKKSAWGKASVEERLKDARLQREQMLALQGDDPDPEWLTTGMSEGLTIVKPNQDYSVQFYKKDSLGNQIGVINPDLLRLEVRIQMDENDIQYIPAEYQAQYVTWDANQQGKLNVHVPASLTKGRLIIGIRPKTQDPAQRALTERWSTVATFEVWNPKAGVISLNESQVVFPKANPNEEMAIDSAFTKDEIVTATKSYLDELGLPLPLVVYGTNYKEGDLINYMVGQRPHSGRVYKVVSTKNGQQLLILAPEILNVYDILLGNDDFFKEIGISPEFIVFRFGDKISEDATLPQNSTFDHIGPSNRVEIQASSKPKAECVGTIEGNPGYSIAVTPSAEIFSDNPSIGLKITSALTVNAGGKIDCKLGVETKFDLGDVQPVARLLKRLIGTGVELSQFDNIKASLGATGSLVSSVVSGGINISKNEGIKTNGDYSLSGSGGNNLKGTPASGKYTIGAESSQKIEFVAGKMNKDNAAGWLMYLINKSPTSDAAELKLSLYLQGTGGLYGNIEGFNAAAVYNQRKNSSSSLDAESSLKGGISLGLTKVLKYFGIKDDLNVSISGKASLLKNNAAYKVDEVEDNGQGSATAKLSWANNIDNSLGNISNKIVSGYASIKDENSSVFNDDNEAISYDLKECKEKGGKITTPFVGCTAGFFCGTVSGDAQLCSVGEPKVTAINASGIAGEKVTTSTNVRLTGSASDSVDKDIQYNVSLSSNPLSTEKSSVNLKLGDSGTVNVSGTCPSKGAYDTVITASTGSVSDTQHGDLYCRCKPGDKDCDKIWGDPYLLTADKLAYDYLASGDYILQRVVDKNNKPIPGLEVQGRFLPGYDVSWTYGAAVRIGNDIVEVMPTILGHGKSSIGMEIKINGKYVHQPAVDGTGGSYEPLLESRVIKLSSGGRIYIDNFVQQYFTYKPAKITLVWPKTGLFKGYALTLSVPEGQFEKPEPFMDFQFIRPDTYAGFERGLMGNNDGNPENDLMRRNGDIISIKNMTDRTQFYALFGGDWLPKGGECLFSDGCRQPDFPTADIVLTPDQRAIGEFACSELKGFYKEACIYDVGLTGNPELVKKAYENTADLNDMANKINVISKTDNGVTTGIYNAKWIRSAIVNQAFTMKAVITNIQGNGEYQIIAVPPKGATVKIDDKAFIRQALANKASVIHNVTIDCKTQDPIFKDLELGTYGQLQLWNINPNTGYPDVMLSQTALSCDSGQRMAAGLHHKLLLDNDGKLWVWGENDKGQLGTGVNYNSDVRYIPTQVNMPDTTVTRITHITAGGNHSIALDNNHKLWAWGENTYGQLGNGSNNYDKPEPIDMTEMNDENIHIVSIGAGRDHSVALDDKGQVWSWGRSNFGQLGIGNRINKTTPVKVNRSNINKQIVQLVAGDYHTLALDIDGNVWTWGDNTYGQLGNGDSGIDKFSTLPTMIDMTVFNGAKITAITAGANHNLVMDSTGKLWTWGNNTHGQLGNNTQELSTKPVLVDNQSLQKDVAIMNISASGDHNVIVDANGNVLAWGSNEYGQLGNGDSFNKSTPTKMLLNLSEFTNIASIVTGSDVTLILDSDGYVYSTGNSSVLNNTINSYNYSYNFSNATKPQVITKLSGKPEFKNLEITPVNDPRTALSKRIKLADVSGQIILPLGGKDSIGLSQKLIMGQINTNTMQMMDRTNNFNFQLDAICDNYGTQTLTYNLFDSEAQPLTNDKNLSFVCYPDVQTKWKVDQDSGNVYLVVTNKSALPTPIHFGISNENWQTELNSGQQVEHIFNSLNCNDTAQNSQKYLMNLDMLLSGSLTAYHQQQAIFYPSSSCGNGLINAGYNHSMISSSKGQLWAWGYNHNGQLGNNWYNYYSDSFNYPIKVNMNNIPLGSVIDVATGNQHNVILNDKDNSLWAWGDNTYGQIGNNEDNNFKVTPVKVDTIVNKLQKST